MRGANSMQDQQNYASICIKPYACIVQALHTAADFKQLDS
jgi:hypothetical protein